MIYFLGAFALARRGVVARNQELGYTEAEGGGIREGKEEGAIEGGEIHAVAGNGPIVLLVLVVVVVCGLLVLGVGISFLPEILENQCSSTFQYKFTLYTVIYIYVYVCMYVYIYIYIYIYNSGKSMRWYISIQIHSIYSHTYEIQNIRDTE
jgi:hypothetical protein